MLKLIRLIAKYLVLLDLQRGISMSNQSQIDDYVSIE